MKKKNKNYPVINVASDGRCGWSGGAFTICFVYSKSHGNFVLKGYYREVRKYLESNYKDYFCNYTLYSRYGHRSIWTFSKYGVIIHEPNSYLITNSNKFHIINYNSDGTENVLKFKRLPRKWIPEFDKL